MEGAKCDTPSFTPAPCWWAGSPAAPEVHYFLRVKIAVVRETVPGETRVAVTPEVAARLRALGHEVRVEPGAGDRADFGDEAYVAAGATVTDTAVATADLVASIHPLERGRVRRLRAGTATVSMLPPGSRDLVVASRDARVAAHSLLLVPRTAAAQSLDAVTSQATVAGYRGAVVAAGMLRRFVPLTMTAAGTLPAAKVLVIGAGVAGLQAIATSRRLGADVTAHDVRPEAGDDVRSVGGTFLDFGFEPLTGEAATNRDLTEEQLIKLREALAPHVEAADAVITAAVVPGRRAPQLITRATLARMGAGAVVVDLAADAGGNVEGVEAGAVTRVGRAQVWGGANVAAQLPAPASTLYAGHVLALVEQWGTPAVEALVLTRDGRIVHEPTRLAVEGTASPAVAAPAEAAPEPAGPLVEERAELAPDDLTEDELLPDDGDLEFYERPEMEFSEDAETDR